MAYRYNDVSVSAEDMGRKFNHSYVILQKYGLTYIQGFNEEYAVVLVGREERHILPHEFVVNQEYPEVGIMVNYKKSCGLVTRVPRRQWVAGLIESTLGMPNAAGYSFFGPGRLNLAAAKALFFPEYPPLDKVYKAVSEDSTVALAFSPYYWMCNPTKESVQLYRRGIEMGVITKEKDTYILSLLDHSCSLEQELKDEIKDVKFTIKSGI